MSGLINTSKKIGEDIAGWVGLKGTYDKVLGATVPALLPNQRGPGVPPAPMPPTFDTAANAANQQQDQMRKRRGILANFYAGASSPAPTVASKQLLGS